MLDGPPWALTLARCIALIVACGSTGLNRGPRALLERDEHDEHDGHDGHNEHDGHDGRDEHDWA
eukprot:10637387-Lingulodinium_polyedra.AAC.1